MCASVSTQIVKLYKSNIQIVWNQYGFSTRIQSLQHRHHTIYLPNYITFATPQPSTLALPPTEAKATELNAEDEAALEQDAAVLVNALRLCADEAPTRAQAWVSTEMKKWATGAATKCGAPAATVVFDIAA